MDPWTIERPAAPALEFSTRSLPERRVPVLVEGRDADALRAALTASPALRVLPPEFEDAARVAVIAPAPDAARAVAALKARRPGLRVLVSLAAADAATVRRLLEAGADAFVAAGTPARDLATLVQALAEGEPSAVPAPVPAPPLAFGLTAREVEVLGFLSAGYSNKEVARRLDVSVRTVETHRFNLRRKTKAGRLKDLVHLARRMGLPPAGEAAAPDLSAVFALRLSPAGRDRLAASA